MMPRSSARCRPHMRACAALLALAVAVIPDDAAGQTGATQSKWSIEVHGGGLIGLTTGGGSGLGQFPVGDTFRTESGLESRSAVSWLFGDGARLFNQVKDQFAAVSGQTFAAIAPLDAMLSSTSAKRKSGPSAGVRIGRRLTGRFGLEFGVDWSKTSLTFSDGARAAVEETRASFQDAFTRLLGTAPASSLVVTSTASYTEATSQQLSIGGGLTIDLLTGRRLSTYAVVGAAAVRTTGDAPEVLLRGTYQFRLFGTFPINEADRLTVRLGEKPTAIAGVIGGGMSYGVSARHGFRVDARVQLMASRTETVIFASPAVTAGQPATVLPSNNQPLGLQFSTTNGIRSTLSGNPLELTTFRGGGTETRFLVTAGYFFRF